MSDNVGAGMSRVGHSRKCEVYTICEVAAEISFVVAYTIRDTLYIR